MIGVDGRSQPYLRRAFSIANADPGRGVVEFLVKVVGVGTACLAELVPGEEVSLLASLGNAFTTEDLGKNDRVAIVAGGVGVAPFPLLLRALAGGASSPTSSSAAAPRRTSPTGSGSFRSSRDGSWRRRTTARSANAGA
jgi:NAD(P)H-flavin reductase